MYDQGHLSLMYIYNFYNNYNIVYITYVRSNACMPVSVKEISEEKKF